MDGEEFDGRQGAMNPGGAKPIVGGRYQVQNRLASGGMADVFVARDQVLGRTVAIKVMFSKYAEDPRFVARFRREATSAANLNHRNIVQVYDWGPHDDTYYIAMEYLEGSSLADLLAGSGPMATARSVEIAAAVASALDYAHSRGTMHRDIKPGNILVTPAGEVKVADFGIARAIEGDESLTDAGTVVGTASYLSPEQASAEQVGPSADLYALGVVLFEMTTGTVPFSAPSPVAVAYKHVHEQPPMPRSLNAAIPPWLEQVILRLLAKDPGDRYRSAAELMAALADPEPAASSAAGSQLAPPTGQVADRGVGSAPPIGPPGTAAPDRTAIMPASPPMSFEDRRFDVAQQQGPGGRGGLIFFLAFLVVAVVVALLYLPRLVELFPDVSNPAESSTTIPEPTNPESTTTVEETNTTAASSSTSSSATTTSSTATTQPPSSATTAPASSATTAPGTTAAPSTSAVSTTSGT